MAGIEALKRQSVDLTSNDPFAAHVPIQFSIPLKPLSLEEQQKELDLEHALMSKDAEWNRLFGHPQAARNGGFVFKSSTSLCRSKVA